MLRWILIAHLALSVTPRIALPPAYIRAKVSVDRTEHSRRLIVKLESDDFGQASEFALDEFAPRTRWVDFKSVPAGEYVVSAQVIDDKGDVIELRTVTVTVVVPGTK